MRVTLLALLGAVASLLLVVTYGLLNPAAMKPVANYLTTALLDRTLTIDGDVALEISLVPRVTAENVRFGNVGWASAEHMATASWVTVKIDLKALLDNRVHLVDLAARELAVNLEDRVDGTPNWVFWEDDEDDTEWSLIIQQLELENARVDAVIGELQPIELTIPRLSETSDAAGNLQLAGHGELNGDPWRLEGSIGTFDELLVGGRIELNMDLVVDDGELSAAGSIANLATLSGVDLALTAYGPDADVLAEIFRMPEAFVGDIALAANIAPDADGHRFDVQGHIAAFEVSAAGTVSKLGELDGWDAMLDIRGPDTGVFGKGLQIAGLPGGPFRVRGSLHLHGGDIDITDAEVVTDAIRVLVNADFADFPRRQGATGNVSILGDDIGQFRELLRLPGLPTRPFELSLALNGTEGVIDASLKVGNHELSASGYVGEFPSYQGTRLDVALEGDDFSRVLVLVGAEPMLAEPYAATAELGYDAGALEFSKLSFATSPVTFDGGFSMADVREPRAFELEGALQMPDLSALGQELGTDVLPTGPTTVNARLRSAATGFELVSATVEHGKLRGSVSGSLGTLTGLAGIDLDVALTGPDVEQLFSDALPKDQASVPFMLNSRVRGLENAIELIGFELKGEGGGISADGVISLEEGFAGSRLQITGRGRSLAKLIPSFPDYKPPDNAWEVTADVALPDATHLAIKSSHGRLGSIEASVSGLLDIVDRGRTDLALEIQGDTLTDLGQIKDLKWPEIPFGVVSKLEGSPEAIHVRRLEIFWGDSDVDATGSVDLTGRPFVTLKGRSSKMNLVDLQKAIFGEPEDDDPADDATRVFPDTPIKFAELTTFDYDLDVDVQISAFHGMRANMNDVILELDFIDGVLRLERVAYRDQIGSFSASGVLRQEGERTHLKLNLIGDEADFGILTSSEQPPETVPRYSMNVAITGVGATLAELAGNLNGTILVYSDGGQINNTALDAFTGDFVSNVLEVLNPFVTSERFTQMECMVLNAAITDGRLKLEPGFVMRTDRVNMFVYGRANLKTERLDLSLATQARRGIGISAASITNPYFKIGGTLASPALELDPASAAIAASVATATAGLSIVIRGFWDRLMGGRNPCPEFLNYKRPEKEQAPPPVQ